MLLENFIEGASVGTVLLVSLPSAHDDGIEMPCVQHSRNLDGCRQTMGLWTPLIPLLEVQAP